MDVSAALEQADFAVSQPSVCEHSGFVIFVFSNIITRQRRAMRAFGNPVSARACACHALACVIKGRGSAMEDG